MARPALRYFRWWPRRQSIRLNIGLDQHRKSTTATLAINDESGLFTADANFASRRRVPGSGLDRTQKPRGGSRIPLYRLAFEADVLSADGQGTRLVDVFPGRSDLGLWSTLLKFRGRKDGPDGIVQIWRGMRDRHVDLPADGPYADIFWQTFSTSFLGCSSLLEEIVEHAGYLRKKTGWDFPFLYYRIMSHALEKQPHLAGRLFDLLEGQDLVPTRCAGHLIRSALASSESIIAFDAFQQVYLHGKERNLYDAAYTIMRNSSASFRTMHRWHTFLVAQGDLPTHATRFASEVKALLKRVEPSEVMMESVPDGSRPEADAFSDALVSNQEMLFTRERLSSVIGEVHGIKQKSVTDAFCARVFATGGISTGFMIGGLAMLGLDQVGPLALRELAARSAGVASFRDALRDLRTRKIVIRDCTFSRALRRFADEGRQDLFDSIVRSDRHPDTYDDKELLERLVAQYLEQDRGVDAHAILVVLTMSHKDGELYRWNALVQAETRNRRPEHVLRLVQDMMVQKCAISEDTIVAIRRHLLRPRRRGHQPEIIPNWPLKGDQDIHMVTNMYLSIMQSGQAMHSSNWREVLRRYGMAGRMNGLWQLAQTLSDHYLSSTSSSVDKTVKISYLPPAPGSTGQLHYSHPLRKIFNPIMQRAIIAWGFKSQHTEQWLPSALKGAVPRHAAVAKFGWLRGIAILAQLRDRGVPIDAVAVRKEVIARLGMLYTPGISVKPVNRALKDSSFMSLTDQVNLVQRIWGRKGLFRFGNRLRPKGTRESCDTQLFRELFVRTGWWARSRRRVGRHVRAGLPQLHMSGRVKRAEFAVLDVESVKRQLQR